MDLFKRALNGYNTKEVDEYVNRTTRSFDEKLKLQSEMIDSLKEQNASLTAELSTYKAKEKTIGDVLVSAQEKAEDIESAAKVRYSLEMQRLKRFQERWLALFNDIKGEYPISEKVENFYAELKAVERDIDKVIEKDLNMGKGITLQGAQAKDGTKFNLQEALTPKQTLAELCEELGLNEE